jgi:hypothetical protein
MLKEKNRLDELFSYQILDTLPETELDELAEIASLICDLPISVISLIDKDRQWFKSNIGLDVAETKREDSFCQHTLHKPKEIFIVEDSLKDPLFKNNPLVIGKPYIRFYAGAPLETPNGNVLGTLCVIDIKPRTITENQKKALQILAKKAMDYLNVRKILIEQKNDIETSAERLKKITDNVPGGIFQMRMSTEGKLSFDFISEGMLKLHPAITLQQWEHSPDIGMTIIHPEDLDNFKNQLLESFQNLSILHIEYRVLTADKYIWHSVDGKPEKMDDGSVVWYGIFSNINNRIEYETYMEQISFDISHVLRRPVTTLLGLNYLIESEENITQSKLLEYVGYIKTVSVEMETFTRNLNEIYLKKKSMIMGNNEENKL